MTSFTNNVELVKHAVGQFQAGNAEGYFEHVADDLKGHVLAGIIPGGENLRSKADLQALLVSMPKYITMTKFETSNWAGAGENVYFTVDWAFTYLPTGKEVETQAVVRKVVRDGKICEKYHVVNAELIKELHLAAANVERVKSLVARFQAGDGAGYMEGVHPKLKGSVLAGIIPGGDSIECKADLGAMLTELPKYMDLKKFEPSNWVGVGDQVFFTVDWEFVWKPTGRNVTTQATVRKVVKDGLICEKHHHMQPTFISNEEALN